jgi:hypothetical protein
VKLVAQALLAAATPVGAENVLTGLSCSELHRRDLINETNQQLETAGNGTCPSSGIRQGTTWLSGKLMGVSPRDQELSNGVPS